MFQVDVDYLKKAKKRKNRRFRDLWAENFAAKAALCLSLTQVDFDCFY